MSLPATPSLPEPSVPLRDGPRGGGMRRPAGAHEQSDDGSRLWRDAPSLPPPGSPEPARSTTVPASDVANKLAPDLTGLRILVADDEELLRNTMVRHLARTGALVTGAKDGHDAIERLRAGRFEAVLLDVNMPRLGGPGVLAALRAAPLPYRPLLVMLTGGDLCDDRGTSYLDLGADVVVQKPVRIATLAAQIALAHAARGA